MPKMNNKHKHTANKKERQKTYPERLQEAEIMR